jgi:hypothetical protein
MAERYGTAKKITVVTKDPSGKVKSVVRFRQTGRKKKGTPGLRSLDNLVRRLARAEVAMEQSYLSRHDRSNEERPDGWLLDLESNLVNAARKGLKKLDEDDNDDNSSSVDDDNDLDDDDDDLEDDDVDDEQ